MTERLKLIEGDQERPIITQKELREVVRLRKNIQLLKERNARVIAQMARDIINQDEFELAQDEWSLMEVLKRGAVIEPGKFTGAVLWKPSRSSRRVWREYRGPAGQPWPAEPADS